MSGFGLLSILALTGVSPAALIPSKVRRKHLRNDICFSCFEKIPDGRPGRKCKKCRSVAESISLSGENNGKDQVIDIPVPDAPSC